MASETLIIVGGNQYEQSKYIEYYDPGANTWSKLVDVNLDRRNFKSIIFEDKLVMVGGIKLGEWVVDVDTYDFATGTYGSLTPISGPVYDCALAVHNGYLYLIGGFVVSHRAGDDLSIFERYNSATREWEVLPDLPLPRRKGEAVVFNDEIYVFGGSYEGVPLADGIAYNPATNSWRTCGSMNEKRNGLSIAVLGDYIYAFTGHDAKFDVNKNDNERYETLFSKTAERYDPVANTWSYIESSNWARAFSEACDFNETIVVAGGTGIIDGVSDFYDFVEQYDPVENKFTVIGPMTQPRIFFDIIRVPWELVKKSIALKNKV